MITFTEKARERVLSFIEQEPGQTLAMRISVQPGSPLAPEYDLSLVEEWEEGPDDQVTDGGGFKVFVGPESASKLEGATVDWVETIEGGGFKIDNPNIKPIGSEPAGGPLADRVRDVIEHQINPGVAMHGGHVNLVDVRDNVVYVQLGGGCQGCGMASVTLKQGIERMLSEAVPEVTEVVDVTDHAVGTNPYYQAAK